MRSTHAWRHSRRMVAPGRREEQGASLVIALVCMIVMGTVVAALLTYAATSHHSTAAYTTQRDQRYAGDAAIKAAVNWAKEQPSAGIDPNLTATPTPCIYQVPTEVGTVTASCAATAGGGSGQPSQGGQLPPEALLMLGERHNDPGQYNAPDCAGWWDTASGWFSTSNVQTGENPSRGIMPEPGAWFRKRKGLGTLSATCDTERTRTRTDFNVQGDLVSASNILVEDGGRVNIVGGAAYARAGCSGGTLNGCPTPNARSGLTGTLAYLNGTAKDTDPGRTNPASPAATPTDIAEPWRAVGFNADGSVKPLDYPPTALMPSAMPNRTTAYFFNPTTGGLTPTNACGGSTATVVFLPGWYRDSSVLNNLTGNNTSSCKDVTFWFAPDPGKDGRLLTTDDRTGAFYFDFRSGSGTGCSSMPVNRSRWCVGTVSDQNARVVAGTPKGWAPLGGAAISPPSGPGAPSRIAVSVGTAGTVDQDLSQSWTNGTRAATIDGQSATYHADVCVVWCFSSDRSIRLRDFSPNVTAPPIEEVDAPKGRIFVEVAYGVTNPALANTAVLEVRAVGAQSGEKTCGTYDLQPKSAMPANGGLVTYRFTNDQAKALANACGTVDLINGLELTLKVTGNSRNTPGPTDINLDGMRISYDTFEGANFPNPVGGSSSNPQAARSDCDSTKPGAQLIFGGSSHVVVGDGSMEVCAGPYPTNPEDHMAVGVWAPPAVAEVGPTNGASDTDAIAAYGGTEGCVVFVCWYWDPPTQTENLTDGINEESMTFRYGGTSASELNAWVDVRMGGYTPPAGYKIDRVTLRAGYHPKNQNCTGLFGCPGANPRLQTDCGTSDWPKISENQPTSQVANFYAGQAAVMYDAASGRNCIGVSGGGASLPQGSIRWIARASGGLSGDYRDTLDGLAYQITLAPTDSTQPRLIPQSGCIVAHPNYNGGSGQPDCALVKAETQDFADNWSLPWASKEGQLRGRFSVQGTIYAPSSPIEVDDTDVAYPLATRGIVVRHLRVSGFGFRNGYQGVAVGNTVDKTPAAREATFVACLQTSARQGQPCDAGQGDNILSRARVRFGVRPASPSGPAVANVPQIQWWVSER